MLKRILKTGITLLVCQSLVYAPLLRAAQLSLPSGDLIAPVITQDKYEGTVRPGTDHEVEVKVTDNVEVKLVTMFYRTIGKGEYKRLTMQKVGTSDLYMVKVNADEIKSPGIEYYIQAMDSAGNTLLHGHSFSPLSVKLDAAAALATESGGDELIKIKSEDDTGISKWVWIGLGVVLVGAAAAASGGGGDSGDSTATLTVNAIEPGN